MEESNESMMERAKKGKSNYILIEKEVGIQKLPQDILFHILARLPAKLLIKLKTACKLWFNIISDPHFVDFHIQQLTSKLTIFEFKDSAYHFWSFNFKEMSNIKAKKVASLQNSQYWFGKSYIISPCASCNDLILFQSQQYDTVHHGIRFWVFNSISHTLKVLPTLPSSFRFINEYLLVHDASIQKYKVFVLCFGKERFLERCCIFNLDENDQISINGALGPWTILSYPSFKQRWVPLLSSVSLNGVLYWTSQYDEMIFIESLEIARQKFMEIIKPPCQPTSYGMLNYTLLAMKGSLCLMNPASADELDIWVLKDYGGNCEYEWTTQYRITLESMVCKPFSLTNFFHCVFKPLFVIESCRSCLMYIMHMSISVDSQLFCYVMECQEVGQIAIEGQDSYFRSYPFITGAC